MRPPGCPAGPPFTEWSTNRVTSGIMQCTAGGAGHVARAWKGSCDLAPCRHPHIKGFQTGYNGSSEDAPGDDKAYGIRTPARLFGAELDWPEVGSRPSSCRRRGSWPKVGSGFCPESLRASLAEPGWDPGLLDERPVHPPTMLEAVARTTLSGRHSAAGGC